MTKERNQDWFNTTIKNFGEFNDSDDFLHVSEHPDGDSLTETQYFGFNVPEANIYGWTYLWVHPNLNVVTGGLFACQGLKTSSMQAELFDVQAYVSKDSVITNDLHAFTMPNGYGVEVIEPGKQMRITYEDKVRGNKLDMLSTAIMPVAMRGNNKHFEQAMKNTGELQLRGKKYKIDNTYNIRDRSWGELRPEEHYVRPPLTWCTGAFGDDFAFNCSCSDDPDRKPEWLGKFDMLAESAFSDGWIFQDGKLIKLVSAEKLTQRDPNTGRPMRHDIIAKAVDGQVFHIKGETTAGLPWSGWPNMVCHFCLTKWECDGRVCWGDTQEVQWNDYVYQFTGN